MENESPGTVASAETQGLDQIREVKEELKPDKGNYKSPGRESAPTGGAAASIPFCFSDSASGATSADPAGWPEAAPGVVSEVFGRGLGQGQVAQDHPTQDRLLCCLQA